MILGFGENSVDIVCRVSAYPQPAGPSKVEIRSRDIRCGGQVATTIATCAALGLPARYAGAFGNDDYGRIIRDELERRGVDVSHALVREAPNRYALIVLDPSGERVVMWQKDHRLALRASDVRDEWLEGVSLVHVDGTDVDAATALARRARALHVPVTCDLDRLDAATAELLASVTVPIVAEPVAPTEADVRHLRQPHHTHVIVTRGARGAAMLHGDRYLEVPGVPVNVVDTTGAGDVFRGACIAALLRGDAPEAMLRFANRIAAESCTREGAMGGVPSSRASTPQTPAGAPPG